MKQIFQQHKVYIIMRPTLKSEVSRTSGVQIYLTDKNILKYHHKGNPNGIINGDGYQQTPPPPIGGCIQIP